MTDQTDQATQVRGQAVSQAEVGCAGILVADTICGPMEHLPHEGQLLAVDALPVHVGGCAANVAIGLHKQGFRTSVAGCLGQDGYAQIIVNKLTGVGIGCEHLVYSDTQPTSQTIILLVRGQDRRYIHMFGANGELSIAHLDRAWLKTLKVFYLGGLFVLPAVDMAALAEVMQFCQSCGVRTVLDVVYPHHLSGLQGLEAVLPHVDYFLPNDEEATRLTDKSDPLDQIRVLRQAGAQNVVITQGEHGAVAAQGHDVWRADAFNVATIDPSGGGDAFAAGLIAGLLRGWDMPRMLALGSALGASATLALGTTAGVFTDAEAQAFLREHLLTITNQVLS